MSAWFSSFGILALNSGSVLALDSRWLALTMRLPWLAVPGAGTGKQDRCCVLKLGVHSQGEARSIMAHRMLTLEGPSEARYPSVPL